MSNTDKKPQEPEQQLDREHARFAQVNRERQRLLPWALVLGVSSGLLAVAFHRALDLAESLRGMLIEQAHDQGVTGLAALLLLTGVGVFLAAWLVGRFAPEASGSGIPHLKSVIYGYRTFAWGRTLVIKFISGVIGIGSGMALGREGPTGHIGGSLGSLMGRGYTQSSEKQRLLIAAGGGAGLAAAFNAPLSGMMFVLEELQGRFASLEFFATAVACLAADVVCRALLGDYPVFRLPPIITPSLQLIPAFILLGAVCGILGVLLNRSLLLSQKLSAWTRGRRRVWWFFWGMLVGLCGLFLPEVIGGGQSFLDRIIVTDSLAGSSILGFLFIRYVLTVGSYATGSSGGIFAPILVFGALIGLGAQHLATTLYPGVESEPYVFAVVGMASFFTGSVRALLTGVVLMIEMTGNYALILPLLSGSFTAMLVADWLHDTPIYEALFQRDLAKLRNHPS
jgi:CIC family chloride channel protein